jgi:hypothetical protein
MKVLALALLCALVLFHPALADSTPQAFLSDILQHDFDGDGGFRIGKAIFTQGPCSKAGDPSCTEAREAFIATADPIELVAKWEFAGEGTVTAQEATLPVNFVAVAETSIVGKLVQEQRVKPLAAPREITVTFHLRRRGSDWVLVNPPLPRVGLFGLIRAIRSEIQVGEEVIKNEADDPASVEVHKKFIVTYLSRIKELEDIAQKMKLSDDAKADKSQ